MTTNLACAFMLLQRVADFEAEAGVEVKVCLRADGKVSLTIELGNSRPKQPVTFRTATEAVAYLQEVNP